MNTLKNIFEKLLETNRVFIDNRQLFNFKLFLSIVQLLKKLDSILNSNSSNNTNQKEKINNLISRNLLFSYFYQLVKILNNQSKLFNEYYYDILDEIYPILLDNNKEIGKDQPLLSLEILNIHEKEINSIQNRLEYYCSKQSTVLSRYPNLLEKYLSLFPQMFDNFKFHPDSMLLGNNINFINILVSSINNNSNNNGSTTATNLSNDGNENNILNKIQLFSNFIIQVFLKKTQTSLLELNQIIEYGKALSRLILFAKPSNIGWGPSILELILNHINSVLIHMGKYRINPFPHLIGFIDGFSNDCNNSLIDIDQDYLFKKLLESFVSGLTYLPSTLISFLDIDSRLLKYFNLITSNNNSNNNDSNNNIDNLSNIPNHLLNDIIDLLYNNKSSLDFKLSLSLVSKKFFKICSDRIKYFYFPILSPLVTPENNNGIFQLIKNAPLAIDDQMLKFIPPYLNDQIQRINSLVMLDNAYSNQSLNFTKLKPILQSLKTLKIVIIHKYNSVRKIDFQLQQLVHYSKSSLSKIVMVNSPDNLLESMATLIENAYNVKSLDLVRPQIRSLDKVQLLIEKAKEKGIVMENTFTLLSNTKEDTFEFILSNANRLKLFSTYFTIKIISSLDKLDKYNWSKVDGIKYTKIHYLRFLYDNRTTRPDQLEEHLEKLVLPIIKISPNLNHFKLKLSYLTPTQLPRTMDLLLIYLLGFNQITTLTFTLNFNLKEFDLKNNLIDKIDYHYPLLNWLVNNIFTIPSIKNINMVSKSFIFWNYFKNLSKNDDFKYFNISFYQSKSNIVTILK
ncbi:hypothetical protein CYY_010185 [Polysphondylium violaceum]|uniref:Uncharacterized protein n=1 Tax=Polysphondylium violaceum TaxID=133409 RepID=A0A8J4UU21_9MYCE|nr:hypothetical protein CYY_010185 [Polysphondylium violaceum]